MRHTFYLLVITGVMACSSDNHRRPALKATLDRAEISLRESVDVATQDTQPSAAVEGRILLGSDQVFSVHVRAPQDQLADIRVDFGGRIVSSAAAGTAPGACSGSISLVEALGVAERTVGGEAVQAIPDDDVACALETQVLVGDILWEVKVGGDGAVLETELSDEFSGSES